MQFIRRLPLLLFCLLAFPGGLWSGQVAAQPPTQWVCEAVENGQWQCEELTPSGSSVRVRGRDNPGADPEADSPAPPMPQRLPPDWVERENLDEEQRRSLPPACCGMFVEPQRDDQWADQPPESSPTEIDTPAPVSQPSSGQMQIDGPLTLRQGYRSLQASRGGELDQEEETVALEGDVHFREPGLVLTGDSAFIDEAAETSQLESSTYVMHESGFHGRAGRLVYDSNSGHITISNGAFSRCEPGSEFWALEASDMDLDTEAGIGHARQVTLRIKDTPVFYYPFTLQFPISEERMSGFLPPDLSNSRRGGLDVSVPYYFNLAPHYDATVTPRLISERGAMLGAELRHLGESSRHTLNIAALPGDRQFDPALADQPGDESPPAEDRWFVGFQHEAQLNDRWSTRIDYSDASDQDYFRDLGSSGLNVNNRSHLDQLGRLRYRSPNWLAEAGVGRIEVLDPFIASIDINKPYDRLPELRLAHQNDLAGLEYGVDTAYTRFDRTLDRNRLNEQQLENGALVTGRRMTAEPRISLPLRTPGTFLVPTVEYRYAQWELENQALGTDPEPERGVGVFSLDSGLIFERGVRINEQAYTQTLEPRLFYLYSEYEDQSRIPTFDTGQRSYSFSQLFRDNRFSGGDRVGDANRLSAALSTRFLDAQGRERAAFSLGQMFHFRDRRVSPDSPLREWRLLQPLSDDRSPVIAEGRYTLSEDWRLRAELQWRDDSGEIEQGSVGFQYEGAAGQVLNLAYRYRQRTRVLLQQPPRLDPVIRQTDISAAWPLNDNWRFLGRWNYDQSNDRNLESFAGLEYSNCCATMRLVFRDWVNDYESLNQNTRQNRGVYFQLSLHGLGDLAGGGISNMLDRGIPGFEEYPLNE